jgi:hypothetical protein
VQGNEGKKARETTIPPPAKSLLTEALDPLMQMYDAWDKPEEVAKWRKEAPAGDK